MKKVVWTLFWSGMLLINGALVIVHSFGLQRALKPHPVIYHAFYGLLDFAWVVAAGVMMFVSWDSGDRDR